MLIVIAGAGEVGYELAKSLSEKNDVYVIDKDREKLERLADIDVVTVRGNAGNLNVLREAKTDKANLFLAVTGNDEINLISALTAKKLGAKKTFVRLENPEYVDRPVIRFHPLGFDVVICPPLALAQEAVRIIGIPPAVEVLTLGSGETELLEIQVTENSNIADVSISDLKLPPKTIITSIYRNGEMISPGIEKLRVGDRITIIGDRKEIKNLKDTFGLPVVRKVTVFGTGSISSYVAETLLKEGVNVKVIGLHKKSCEDLSERLRDLKVVCGNYLDLRFLLEEEVGKSDAIIAFTESDERNLMLSLLSKKLGARKAIAKVEKSDYVEIFEKVGVDVVLNPRKIAMLEVLKLLMAEKIEVKTMAEIGGSVIIEVAVRNEKIASKKISELEIPKDSVIAVVIREGEYILPYDELQLNFGDTLLIHTTWRSLGKVEEIFG